VCRQLLCLHVALPVLLQCQQGWAWQAMQQLWQLHDELHNCCLQLVLACSSISNSPRPLRCMVAGCLW
jgi:hypothetical protein